MSMSRESGVADPSRTGPNLPSGSWSVYRDRMITAGQMTAPVRWAGLATALDRVPGVFVVADRYCDDEQVLDIGHAHDLRAHFADAHRIANWHDRTYGQVVIYTIPNSTVLDHHLPGSAIVGIAPEQLADD